MKVWIKLHVIKKQNQLFKVFPQLHHNVAQRNFHQLLHVFSSHRYSLLQRFRSNERTRLWRYVTHNTLLNLLPRIPSARHDPMVHPVFVFQTLMNVKSSPLCAQTVVAWTRRARSGASVRRDSRWTEPDEHVSVWQQSMDFFDLWSFISLEIT